ncbi:hypothetical protein PLEOSDRAFT_171735 [Pleurotus ostreatus PC15]|uniref:Uncharacterized protein n=1 Tax=Pleurotus ostreatus (strain PC15) TaxID=1137138 RepID=A0A067NF16_PLEO1|nr:hypothetical protein PLEOSDRAFT_171735 [Pleurotus ostreatus PC15]
MSIFHSTPLPTPSPTSRKSDNKRIRNASANTSIRHRFVRVVLKISLQTYAAIGRPLLSRGYRFELIQSPGRNDDRWRAFATGSNLLLILGLTVKVGLTLPLSFCRIGGNQSKAISTSDLDDADCIPFVSTTVTFKVSERRSPPPIISAALITYPDRKLQWRMSFLQFKAPTRKLFNGQDGTDGQSKHPIRATLLADEEMKKIVLKVVKQCAATEGVTAQYIKQDILPDFFRAFWVRRMVLDRRNYKQVVETTVELAQKAGVSEIVGRVVNELKDEAEPYRKMVMASI